MGRRRGRAAGREERGGGVSPGAAGLCCGAALWRLLAAAGGAAVERGGGFAASGIPRELPLVCSKRDKRSCCQRRDEGAALCQPCPLLRDLYAADGMAALLHPASQLDNETWLVIICMFRSVPMALKPKSQPRQI